jgi:hypothetical protein
MDVEGIGMASLIELPEMDWRPLLRAVTGLSAAQRTKAMISDSDFVQVSIRVPGGKSDFVLIDPMAIRSAQGEAVKFVEMEIREALASCLDSLPDA